MLAAVPGFVVLVTGPTEVSSCTINGDGEFDFDGELRGLCEGPTGATIGIAVLLFVLAGVAFFLYQSRRQGTTGATIGKAAVGIKVVDSNTGAYIGFGRSLGRQLFAAFISGNICMLGYLWALWDSRKQTWHDKVVNSVVIKT